MTTPANAAVLPTVTDKDILKSIYETAIGSRSRATFDTLEAAKAQLTAAAAKLGTDSALGMDNILGVPVFYPDNVPEGSKVYVSTLGVRVKGEKGQKGVDGIRAIMVYPMPPVEAVIELAPDFVEKCMVREMADVVYSGFRGSATYGELAGAMKAIPLDVETIVSTSRSSMDLSFYNEYWPMYRKAFLEENGAFKPYIPGKDEMLKGFRSASYAKAHEQLAPLEAKGLIVKIAHMFMDSIAQSIAEANATSETEIIADDSQFREFIENRENVHLSYNVPEVGDGSELVL